MNETERQEAIRIAWMVGRLAYKYRPIQRRFNEAWAKARKVGKKFVLNSGRRTTKSSWLLLTDFETCIQEPRSYLAFVAPVEKALSEYIQQIGNELLSDCPNELRPVWISQAAQYRFANGSIISFAGSNQQSYNNLRGKKFKRASVDEAAFVDNLQELVEGVLIPAISDSNGYLRLSSSPPDVPDHPFEEYYRLAEREGAAAHFTIEDAGYPGDWVETWLKELGGRNSTVARREYFAEFVLDDERKIIPEFKLDYVQNFTKDKLFTFWDKYFSVDTGTVDKTVGLLAFYVFPTATLHVVDEIVFEGRSWTTADLAKQIKERELEHWGPDAPVYRRTGDSNNQIILADLNHLHGLPVMPTSKLQTTVAMVNEVRMWVAEGRVKVHPRCKLLAQTLKSGVWTKSGFKDDFARTRSLGHMDAIAALMYLIRNIDPHHNPVPVTYGFDPASQYWNPQTHQSKSANAFQKAYVNENPFIGSAE